MQSRAHRFIGAIIALLAPAASLAQHASTHGTPVVDLTFARHGLNGGVIDYRNGAMADLLVAGEIGRSPRWIMMRVTVLPSHGGDALVAWAAGGSLVVQ
jgi:hypothetical protein